MCVKIAKYLLFIFNIIFWIAGGVALGIGIYFRVKDDASNVVEVAGITFYYAGCYLMISVGSVMFVIGFLGCCGAIKENRCLLGLYFACLLVIFLAELTIGILGLAKRDEIEEDIQRNLNKSVPLIYDDKDAYVQSVIATEIRFECCGLVAGCHDWQNGVTYGCACNLTSKNCRAISATGGCTIGEDVKANGIYAPSCYQSVEDAILDNLAIVGGIALGIGLVEIFGMIFVGVLCSDIKKKEYQSY